MGMRKFRCLIYVKKINWELLTESYWSGWVNATTGYHIFLISFKTQNKTIDQNQEIAKHCGETAKSRCSQIAGDNDIEYSTRSQWDTKTVLRAETKLQSFNVQRKLKNGGKVCKRAAKISYSTVFLKRPSFHPFCIFFVLCPLDTFDLRYAITTAKGKRNRFRGDFRLFF